MTYRSDHFTALLDACVLAGVFKRNLLLSLAEAELFRPRWSALILEEMERAITKITNGEVNAASERESVESAFEDACVVDFEQLIPAMNLPDPDDRHVLAAAVATHAQVIVTDNLKDFPADELGKFSIELKSLDEFIADTITLHDYTAVSALRKMRQRFRKPALSTRVIIQTAESQGLLKTALLMKEYERYW